jgi:virulence-associated protein VagC
MRASPKDELNPRIFMNDCRRAVLLPEEFQFQTREVFIRREGKATT